MDSVILIVGLFLTLVVKDVAPGYAKVIEMGGRAADPCSPSHYFDSAAAACIREDLEFSSDLSQQSSVAYTDLKVFMETQIGTALSKLTTPNSAHQNIHVEVLGFRNGSVLAEVLFKAAILHDTTAPALLTLLTTMSLEPASFQQTRVEFSNIAGTFFDRCVLTGTDSWCEPGRQCRFEETTGTNPCPCLPGHVPAEQNGSCLFDPCNASPCGLQATCQVDLGHFDGRRCLCAQGHFRSLTRPETDSCSPRTNVPYDVVYAVAGITGGIVLILSALFFYLARRGPARDVAEVVYKPNFQFVEVPPATVQQTIITPAPRFMAASKRPAGNDVPDLEAYSTDFLENSTPDVEEQGENWQSVEIIDQLDEASAISLAQDLPIHQDELPSSNDDTLM